MELSELGSMIMGFIGGTGFGAIVMGYLAYKTGAKKKEKSKVEIIEERLEKIETELRKWER